MVRILQNPSGQLQMKIVEWNDMTNKGELLITVLLSTNHKSIVYMLFYNNVSKWLT